MSRSNFAWLGVVAVALSGLGAQGCPPSPVVPDSGAAGSDGAGGSPGFGGSVVVDAGPDVVPDVAPVPAVCKVPEGVCCRSCAVLTQHGCPEGQPTAAGATCEDRCLHHTTGPAVLRTPDVSACTGLACVRSPAKGKRGIACEGGR